MNLKLALKLRAKTAALRGVETTLAWSARWAKRGYFATMANPKLGSRERIERMTYCADQAQQLDQLRRHCRFVIEQHQFDIIMHNEGMADRGETEDRAV